MIGRGLKLLRRGEPSERPLRPNELRREVARAERLRRAGRLAVASPTEAERPTTIEPTPTAADPPPRRGDTDVPRVLREFGSRSGLRRAWLAQEILGPPRALRGFGSGEREG